MDIQTKYNNYNFVLTQLKGWNYLGISIDNILRKDISFVCYQRIEKKELKFKNNLKAFFQRYDFSAAIEFFRENEFVFTKIIDRPNYNKLIENVLNQTQNNFKIFSVNPIIVRNVNFFTILKSSFWFLKSVVKYPSLSKELFFLSGILCRNLNSIKFIQKIPNNFKLRKFISFDATFGFDAFIVEYLKTHNIETASLQHSLFYHFEKFIPEEIIKYNVNISDHYYLWSEQQKEYLINFHNADPHKLIVCGNPNYLNYIIPRIEHKFKSCIVLLSRWYYHEGNLKLIDLIGQLKLNCPEMNFYVKLHPSLFQMIGSEVYENILLKNSLNLLTDNKTIAELISEYQFDFSISYHTAAYFDALFCGLISFRFAENENETITGMNDKFVDYQSLLSLIKQYSNNDQNENYNQIIKVCKTVGGYEINRYNQL